MSIVDYLTNLKSSLTKKKIKTIKTKFDLMKASIDKWRSGEQDDRFVSRLFYNGIGLTSTGWTTIGYQMLKEAGDLKKKVTKDHFMMPQFLGMMVMDLSDIYLTGKNSFEKFLELSLLGSRVILTTKEENTRLAGQSPEFLKLGNGVDFLKYSVIDKYEAANIKLWNEVETNGIYDGFPLYIPQEVLEYEARFINNDKV